MPRPHQHLEDFDKPWCRALLDSPDYEAQDGFAKRHNPRSSQDGSTRNVFFTETLATPITMRACLILHKPALEPREQESLFLMSIGRGGTDGHNGVMHGGMIYSILDEIQGMVCNSLNVGAIMTGQMTVRYKKYVSTPCLLLAKSHFVREQGRKIWTIGTLEDGHGTVHAECEALFIKLKKSNL